MTHGDSEVQNEIDNLIFKLNKLTVDDEWVELHKWFRQFREKNKITTKQFLELCDEAPTVTYLQYLTPSGEQRKVSNKPDTVGYRLRNLLKIAREKFSDNQDIHPSEVSPRDIVEDVFLNNAKQLRQDGIVTFSIDEPEDPTSLALNIYLDPSSTLTNAQVEQCIKRYSPKPLALKVTTLKRVEPLMQLLINPQCLAGEKVGTGTLIVVSGYTLCLTAAHNLPELELQPSGEIKSNVVKDAFGKYLKSAPSNSPTLGVYTNICFAPGIDVAVVIPLSYHPMTVNYIEGLGTIHFDETLTKEQIAVGSQVRKHGCATGITVGTIAEVRDDKITIKGTQVGRFAIHGDSGALLLDSANKVIGILNLIELTKDITFAIPIWQFYPWLKELFE